MISASCASSQIASSRSENYAFIRCVFFRLLENLLFGASTYLFPGDASPRSEDSGRDVSDFGCPNLNFFDWATIQKGASCENRISDLISAQSNN